MRRLDEAALELVVVEKIRPDIGLPVVQAIVLDLRHFWPRFGPGRLYQVPCALGWPAGPLAEGELNPVPRLVQRATGATRTVFGTDFPHLAALVSPGEAARL